LLYKYSLFSPQYLNQAHILALGEGNVEAKFNGGNGYDRLRHDSLFATITVICLCTFYGKQRLNAKLWVKVIFCHSIHFNEVKLGEKRLYFSVCENLF
jgi:hypothetical protein